jgi:hypothetical protein
MIIRSLFAALLATAAVATACSTQTAPPPMPAPPVTVMAFHQAGHMRLADSNGRVFGDVAVSATPQRAVWSADNKYVAWLDQTRLHVVDAATGIDHAQPCPCNGLARMGSVFATLSADGAALLTFDGTGAATRIALRSPQAEYSSVVAGGRDQVAVSVEIPEDKADYRGQSALTAIDRTGGARPMIAGKSAVSIGGGFDSPDGTRIATIESPSHGACWSTPGVFSLQANGVNPIAERMVPADPPFDQAAIGQSRAITGMSWAGDAIVVTFGPLFSCQATHPDRYVSYSLTGTEWHFLRTGMVAMAFGAQGRSYGIEFAERAVRQQDEQGKLVLTSADGSRKTLAENVSGFWTTPAEQAAGRPVPGPQPDQKITTTDHGTPVPQPFLTLAGQLAKALDGNDTATLSTLCAGCDASTRTLLQSPEGRKSIRDSLRTHPAADHQSATFPGLTNALCTDDPKATPGCTAEQIKDVGILHLPGETDFKTSGMAYRALVKGSVRFSLDASGSAHWTGQSISAQNYRLEPAFSGAPESYFFQSPDTKYLCGFDAQRAACQGSTQPIPARPASCPEGGPGWGHGMFVTPQETGFVCAGGVMYYPVGRQPEDKDRLTEGQAISALGFTCTAEKTGIQCKHDASGHGFRIAPDSNERF